jgi:hypothetical protein
MKKTPAEATSADNLEAKFDRGENVIDYFDTQHAKVILPRNRAPAQYLVELPAKQTVVGEPPGSYAGGVSRKSALKNRTQSKNPKTNVWTKRNETRGSAKEGEFMDVKSRGKKFKSVAKEPAKRRK